MVRRAVRSGKSDESPSRSAQKRAAREPPVDTLCISAQVTDPCRSGTPVEE